jgi:predicted AAA+ superfamily ATPase
VIKQENKIRQAIQVCYSLNEDNKGREVGGLLEALETFDLSEGLILTFNQQDILKIDGKIIKIIPAWRWSEGLFS